MSAPNDGGPAFPVMETTESWPVSRGLSLRDYFAGQASDPPQFWMDAWIKENFPLPSGAMVWTNPTPAQQIRARAQWAYEFADAMLAARGAQVDGASVEADTITSLLGEVLAAWRREANAGDGMSEEDFALYVRASARAEVKP